MPDMKKVINHLNDCLTASRQDNTWVFVRKDIVNDAIALLKEQEAIEPITDNEDGYWCGSCHEDMVWRQKYCSNCGRLVKWNE